LAARVGRHLRPLAAHPAHARHAAGGNALTHVPPRRRQRIRRRDADQLEPMGLGQRRRQAAQPA
jgi:hypothetical protein